MMATNYIGAFSLTKLLLPLLKNSPTPSRIVNVTSFTHRNGKHVSDMFPETFVSPELDSGLSPKENKRIFYNLFQS